MAEDEVVESELEDKLDLILARDNRYRAEAYAFVLAALSFTIQRKGVDGHVTAAELMAGIRDFAVQQFGPLARSVFEYWGIARSAAFGDLVFNMIDVGVLGRQESDTRADFNDAAFDLNELDEPNDSEG